jgi:hypothetical protein
MPSTKQLRKEQALIRQAKYDALGIDEKIKLVQSRDGSKKELSRLFDKKLKKETSKE